MQKRGGFMKNEKKAKKGLSLKIRLILVGVILFLIGFFPLMNLETETIVKMDNKETVIKGKRLESLSSALRRNHFPRNLNYEYSVNLINFLTNVSEVTITKKNNGEIKVDDQTIKYHSGKRTVGEVLEEAGVTLEKVDRIEPSLETALTEEVKEIKVYRVTYKDLEPEKKETPMTVSISENPEMGFGTFTKTQEGKSGQNLVKERIRYENGLEVGRESVSEEVIEPVIETKIEVGPMTTLGLPKGMVPGTITGNVNVIESESDEITGTLNKEGFAGNMMVSATAYTATGNSTASGTWPQSGRTIATWSGIPFGTKVYIPALNGIYVVEDRGGAVTQGIIDIYMDSEGECVSWGRQNIEIFIMPE